MRFENLRSDRAGFVLRVVLGCVVASILGLSSGCQMMKVKQKKHDNLHYSCGEDTHPIAR